MNFVYCADNALVALLVEALERVGRADGVLRARLLARLAIASHFNLNGSAEARERFVLEAIDMADRLTDPATRPVAFYS